VIADSVELTMRGHSYDALVGHGRLRQVAAGHDDGDAAPQRAVDLHLWRLDPAGPLPRPRRHRVRMCSRRSAYSVGKMDDETDELERVACPSAGACGGQYTANTMATVAEAIGLALPYSCGAPGALRNPRRACACCRRAGDGTAREEYPPARHRHPQGVRERRAVVAATGGSTNAALHLPAMAHEAGIEFDLFDVAEIFKKTPYIADLKPGGKYVAKDMFEAGGIPLVMKALLDGGSSTATA
jgi:dihydroxy-acid dehydratase